jgi:glutamate dehydrogenase/leucine dehydrogenase
VDEILLDRIGPRKVLRVHDSSAGLEAIVVVDNVSAGPAIGGVRLAPDVSDLEVARLARAMTLKNAAAGLPHGGGKAGIRGAPTSDDEREALIRAFARAIADLREYIPGPDMGTDERCMAWVHDEIGRAVGLPAVLGGIPLDELGATAHGLVAAAEAAEAAGIVRLDGARVVIQGFGSVGRHAARFLRDRGAVLVAASDSRGAVRHDGGLDVDALVTVKAQGGSVTDADGLRQIDPDDLVTVPCDIWVPAARPDVLTVDNASFIDTKLVLEGANVPATPGAEQMLHKAGVTVVPDFIANAGGVICASVEYHGGTRAQAFELIHERVRSNTEIVLARSKEQRVAPRQVAEALALERVEEAASYRRYR